MRPAVSRPYLTYILIAINVAVWVTGFGLDFVVFGRIDNPLGSSRTADSLGALYGPLVARGEWWRLFTSGFLHAGLTHLALNMVALVAFGSVLEPGIGRARFAAVYLTSLVASSMGVLLVSPGALTVGASGAIFGLLGAILVGTRMAGMSFMARGWLVLIVINVIFTFVQPGISIGGHLGGLAAGLVCGLLVFSRRLVPSGRLAAVLATVACLVLGAAMFAASLWLAANPIWPLGRT